MDTRAVFNLTRRARLEDVPELAGARGLVASLSAGKAVRRTAPVSVIIPAFFNQKLKGGVLRDALEGLARSRAVCEVILVCSDEDAEERRALLELPADVPVRVVDSPANNRAQSRNAGAARARGEFLLYLDDDMIVRDWRLIDVLVSELLEDNFDCALFPRRQYTRFPGLYDRAGRRRTIEAWKSGSEDAGLRDLLDEETIDLPMLFCFPGCFMLIRKEAYQALAGFNEDFVGWGFEDTDFAVRAIRQLRVLNLFRSGEPLLHVDHPVSPYKLDEHRSNSSLFFRAPGVVDVHRLCRSVFPGENFVNGEASLLSEELHLEPFRELRKKGVPVDAEELRPWLLGVAQEMLERFVSPVPEFLVLHGSRATGRAREDSDYDLLCLYAAPIQEFFVTRSRPAVEIETTCLLAFAALAEAPWLYDYRGVLELTKVAQARLLIGSEERWKNWRGKVLADAVRNGRTFWLTLGLGMLLNRGKYGAMCDRYLNSLRHLFDLARVPDDLEELLAPSPERLGRHLLGVLNADLPGWQDKVEQGEKVFALQVPEVCAALHWLADGIADRRQVQEYAVEPR